MPLKAIFLGSLGTLAETSELQRRALNAAFSEAGLNWEWTLGQYRERAGRWCCAKAIAAHARDQGVPVDVDAVCRRRNEIFRDLLRQVRIPPRPGLNGLIEAAHRAQLDLALVTTTDPEDVEAMLAVTGLDRGTFAFVGDASLVDAPKPAPDIYHTALSALSLTPNQAIAIEETPESAESAAGAGISCVAFPGAEHLGSRFGALASRVDALAPRHDDSAPLRIARRA